MAATVVSDAAIALRREKEHLRLPTVRTERPAVAEDDGFPIAPILEINLCAVLSADRVHSATFASDSEGVARKIVSFVLRAA